MLSAPTVGPSEFLEPGSVCGPSSGSGHVRRQAAGSHPMIDPPDNDDVKDIFDDLCAVRGLTALSDKAVARRWRSSSPRTRRSIVSAGKRKPSSLSSKAQAGSSKGSARRVRIMGWIGIGAGLIPGLRPKFRSCVGTALRHPAFCRSRLKTRRAASLRFIAMGWPLSLIEEVIHASSYLCQRRYFRLAILGVSGASSMQLPNAGVTSPDLL